jgi:hypothetical protein
MVRFSLEIKSAIGSAKPEIEPEPPTTPGRSREPLAHVRYASDPYRSDALTILSQLAKCDLRQSYR